MGIREVVVGLPRAISVPRAALVIGGWVVLLAALNIVGPPSWSLSFRARLGLPGLTSGALLGMAAALAVALGAVRVPGGARLPARAGLAAALLGLAAVYEAAAISKRAVFWLDAPHAAAHAPAAVLALAAALAVVALLSEGGRRRRYAALALAWPAAKLLVLPAGRDGADQTTAAALDLAAVAVLLLVLLAAVRDEAPSREELSLRETVVEGVASMSPRAAALALAAAIAVLAGVGLMVDAADVQLSSFDLGEEHTVASFFSGALLLGAAGLAFVVREVEPGERRGAWAWALFGGCLVLLAFDELAALHEVLEDEVSYWRALLAPVALLAFVAWLAAVRALSWEPRARWLLVLGAAAWGLSQALDLSHSPDPTHPLVFPEEVLEMIGSALFCIGLLTAAHRAIAEHRPEPAGAAAGPRPEPSGAPVG